MWSPLKWSTRFRCPLISGFPGRGPALNPKLTRPGRLEKGGANHPPPVTKSLGAPHSFPQTSGPPPRVPRAPEGATPPRGRPPPSHVTELYALDTTTSTPAAHAWRAFTVIAFVVPDEESSCSLMIRVRRPGTSNTWFGSPVTMTGSPATRSPASSVDPYASAHVATLSVYPPTAVTGVGVSARRRMSEVAVSLIAGPSNPAVSDRKAEASATPVSTEVKSATRTPPPSGRSPVSAKYVPPKIGTAAYTPYARPP